MLFRKDHLRRRSSTRSTAARRSSSRASCPRAHVRASRRRRRADGLPALRHVQRLGGIGWVTSMTLLGYFLGKISGHQADREGRLPDHLRVADPGRDRISPRTETRRLRRRRSPPDGRQARAPNRRRRRRRARRRARRPRPGSPSRRRRPRRPTPSSQRALPCPRRQALRGGPRLPQEAGGGRRTSTTTARAPAGPTATCARENLALLDHAAQRGGSYGIVALDADAQKKVAWDTLTDVARQARKIAHGTPALFWLDIPLDGTGAADFKSAPQSQAGGVRLGAIACAGWDVGPCAAPSAARKKLQPRDDFLPAGAVGPFDLHVPTPLGGRPTDQVRDETTAAMVETVSLGAAIAIGAVGCLGEDAGGHFSLDRRAVARRRPARHQRHELRGGEGQLRPTETQQDGLGPIFNERSCSACHSNGATGGAGQNVERRYGTLTNGVFNGLGNTGGSLRQLFGIGGYNPSPGLNCQSGTDANPAPGATMFAGRVTTPTFGLGLVELIPDGTIQAIAAAQPAAIRGIANMATIHLTTGPFVRGQTPRGAVRLEGRPREPGGLRRRRLPERDGDHHHELRGAERSSTTSPPRTGPTGRPPTPSSTAARTTSSPAPTTTSPRRPTTARAASPRSRTTWRTSPSSCATWRRRPGASTTATAAA